MIDDVSLWSKLESTISNCRQKSGPFSAEGSSDCSNPSPSPQAMGLVAIILVMSARWWLLSIHAITSVQMFCWTVGQILHLHICLLYQYQCCIVSCSSRAIIQIAGWLDVCVSSNFFHIANFPTVFSDSHETCTHDLCTKMQKTMEQVFEFLLLKFVDNFFLNFTLGLSYWKQQLWL